MPVGLEQNEWGREKETSLEGQQQALMRGMQDSERPALAFPQRNEESLARF